MMFILLGFYWKNLVRLTVDKNGLRRHESTVVVLGTLFGSFSFFFLLFFLTEQRFRGSHVYTSGDIHARFFFFFTVKQWCRRPNQIQKKVFLLSDGGHRVLEVGRWWWRKENERDGYRCKYEASLGVVNWIDGGKKMHGEWDEMMMWVEVVWKWVVVV